MKRVRINIIYIIIIAITLVIIVYSTFNTKNFDLKFTVEEQSSDVQVDNVFLTGKLVRFPLNKHYIRGVLIIGDDTYQLTNYKRVGFNKTTERNVYQVKFTDKESEDSFYGVVTLQGDIIRGDLIDIGISIDITDKTGFTYSKTINTKPIQGFKRDMN